MSSRRVDCHRYQKCAPVPTSSKYQEEYGAEKTECQLTFLKRNPGNPWDIRLKKVFSDPYQPGFFFQKKLAEKSVPERRQKSIPNMIL